MTLWQEAVDAAASTAVAVDSFFGYTPASSAALNAPTDISRLAADLVDLNRWNNVLASRNKTTPAASRPSGSQTAQAVNLWASGVYADAVDALHDAIEQGNSLVAQATVTPPSNGMLADFAAAKQAAFSKYDKAAAQAAQVSALFDQDAADMSRGVTASDFTPVEILRPGYASASAAATSAASAISSASKKALAASLPWLPYVTFGAAALAALYVSGAVGPWLAPFLKNPRRRRGY